MQPIRKVLVANRGEIALRIIRACRELGLETVAIYSQPDRDSLHVRAADEAYCVGPAAQSESYTNIPNILSVARISGADAVHPGYGFLSEKADFAEKCEAHGLTFIGPSSKAIASMGDKAQAKETMRQAGVPVIPGSDGILCTLAEAERVASEIGFPVLIKASAGGGGRGMRVAETPEKFARAFQAAQSEAATSFGNPAVYLERLIQKPRHIEIQIMADQHGNTVYFPERECSLQRKHQKVLEESPSPVVDDELRQRMGEAAVRAAQAVGYVNAGTIEFLLDMDGSFYFMEMNTRIQVEHPVTEMITLVDLVKEQILVAAGQELGFTQEEIRIYGHAIECRINAEDPKYGFRPSPGPIQVYQAPGGPGVRIDSYAYQGGKVLPYYDSMFAKLITWGLDRKEAIARAKRALMEYEIQGIKTNIPFHLEIMDHPKFLEGNITTDFIQREFLSKQE